MGAERTSSRKPHKCVGHASLDSDQGARGTLASPGCDSGSRKRPFPSQTMPPCRPEADKNAGGLDRIDDNRGCATVAAGSYWGHGDVLLVASMPRSFLNGSGAGGRPVIPF